MPTPDTTTTKSLNHTQELVGNWLYNHLKELYPGKIRTLAKGAVIDISLPKADISIIATSSGQALILVDTTRQTDQDMGRIGKIDLSDPELLDKIRELCEQYQ